MSQTHTYIFKNMGDYTLVLTMEPGGRDVYVAPGEMFTYEGDDIPPVLLRQYNDGNLDYWTLDTRRVSVDWRREGF